MYNLRYAFLVLLLCNWKFFFYSGVDFFYTCGIITFFFVLNNHNYNLVVYYAQKKVMKKIAVLFMKIKFTASVTIFFRPFKAVEKTENSSYRIGLRNMHFTGVYNYQA